MITRDQILADVMCKWGEHLEMYPDGQWEVAAGILAAQLEKQIEETEYYKRLSHARISTKY